MGHEIGYHYETFDEAVKSSGFQVSGFKSTEEFEIEIAKIAIELFEEHLEKLRKYYPVKTICMHGSPLSKYDNKLLWKYYNYKDYGIIGEPYFDIDFNEIFYLTDTGRRWDGDRVSIRDKVNRSPITDYQSQDNWPTYHSTSQITEAIESGTFPSKAMITFHPQRWTDKPVPWMKELLLQNVKNVIKKILIRSRT